MIINTRTYADFKAAAQSLRRLDTVLYNNSATVAGSPIGVAYAFDFQAGVAVVGQASGFTFSTTDFPNAAALSDHLQVSDASALASSF